MFIGDRNNNTSDIDTKEIASEISKNVSVNIDIQTLSDSISQKIQIPTPNITVDSNSISTYINKPINDNTDTKTKAIKDEVDQIYNEVDTIRNIGRVVGCNDYNTDEELYMTQGFGKYDSIYNHLKLINIYNPQAYSIQNTTWTVKVTRTDNTSSIIDQIPIKVTIFMNSIRIKIYNTHQLIYNDRSDIKQIDIYLDDNHLLSKLYSNQSVLTDFYNKLIEKYPNDGSNVISFPLQIYNNEQYPPEYIPTHFILINDNKPNLHLQSDSIEGYQKQCILPDVIDIMNIDYDIINPL